MLVPSNAHVIMVTLEMVLYVKTMMSVWARPVIRMQFVRTMLVVFLVIVVTATVVTDSSVKMLMSVQQSVHVLPMRYVPT